MWPAAPLSDTGLERLAQRHPDGARLVGRESESCATTPFPVEGEQRLLVGHVVDVEDCRKSPLEVHPRAEVDQIVFGELEIDRRLRGRPTALAREAVHEGARVTRLVRGLRQE